MTEGAWNIASIAYVELLDITMTMYANNIEESGTASKSPNSNLANFLSISQQGVSDDIIQSSNVGNFSPKTEGTQAKTARC
jgi:hypothetical protein